MKVAVIGCGVVGGALVHWLRSETDHELALVDPPKGVGARLDKISCAFICVPAPTRPDRTQDVSVVEHWIEHLAFHCVPIFIRSSVLPGTCDRLAEKHTAEVYAMPEFLTERRANEDVVKHPIVCGGRDHGMLPEGLQEFMVELLPDKGVIFMSNVEAELAKYTHNTFGAMKVNYFNIVSELCLKMRANYNQVLRAARITGFIEHTHTQVPGPDGKYGFGGACLPKDLSAFVGLLKEFGVIGVDTLRCIEHDNAHYRVKGQDQKTCLTPQPRTISV